MAPYTKFMLLSVLLIYQVLATRSGNVPQSLYDSNDLIVQLDNETISKTLFNSGNSWIVEFYSSWCGHCIRFAPTWKQLAKDLKAWKSVIGVASMDCAIQRNFEVCRTFDIEGYPTLKLFNASSQNNTGIIVTGGRLSKNLRHAMINHVESHSDKIRPKHWPILRPIRKYEVVAFKESPSAKYLAVIFEDEKSYIGREVILDMVPYPKFKVARATKNDTVLTKELQVTSYPSLFVFYPDGQVHELKSMPDPTRETFRSLLLDLLGLTDSQDPPKETIMEKSKPSQEDRRDLETNEVIQMEHVDAISEADNEVVKFLKLDNMPGIERQQVPNVNHNNGEVVEEPVNAGNEGAVVETKDMWDIVKKKKYEAEAGQQQQFRNIDAYSPVHMQDLESALTYALRQEVPLKVTIGGSALEALRNFVNVLNKYFPGRSQVSMFLESLEFWLEDLKGPSITSDEWLDFVNENYDPEKSSTAVLPHSVKWEGCQGSSPRYRGYPCSIWTLFHTLTVSAAKINKQNPNRNSQEVLLAMQGYIQVFFGCTECVKNFAKESKSMSSSVKSYDDAILWLWKTHNRVNERLKGDISEDPAHPKIQFPPTQLCSACRLGKGHENEWVNSEVLVFLKEYYGVRNIVFDQLNIKRQISNLKEKEQLPPERFFNIDNIKLKHEAMKRQLEKQLEVRLAEERLKQNPGYDFRITDMDLSMCVFMYAVCISLCLFVYLVVCRRRRKKMIKQKV
ncbi:sulfhydryl oxidase 2-like isoform X3 [Anneissia japonica]|uniref:sulfhydryl oxidase 2-like isoform X3 n=1 Tax=Anneissia japonica TaxID=1529436 RepID=UPI0014259C2D|nr:sulfhydryl oxidase 2-like isoform X3 [Anneissia japonica]